MRRRPAAGTADEGAGTASAKKAASAKKTTPSKKTATTKKPATAAKAPAKKAVTKAPANKASANKASAKKAPAKKASTVADKTPAKKAAAKKAAPTKAAAKAPAKKAPAKKAAPEAPARKTAAKKAPAKTAPAKKSPTKKAPVSALIVKEDEEAWTKAELAEVLTELHEQREHSARIVAAQEAELSGLMRDAGDGAGHDQADLGATSFERDHELTVLNNERDKLAQIERALLRIDDGSYGRCESCGNPIGKMRLMAFPRATLCLTCKQREERR